MSIRHLLKWHVDSRKFTITQENCWVYFALFWSPEPRITKIMTISVKITYNCFHKTPSIIWNYFWAHVRAIFCFFWTHEQLMLFSGPQNNYGEIGYEKQFPRKKEMRSGKNLDVISIRGHTRYTQTKMSSLNSQKMSRFCS